MVDYNQIGPPLHLAESHGYYIRWKTGDLYYLDVRSEPAMALQVVCMNDRRRHRPHGEVGASAGRIHSLTGKGDACQQYHTVGDLTYKGHWVDVYDFENGFRDANGTLILHR